MQCQFMIENRWKYAAARDTPDRCPEVGSKLLEIADGIANFKIYLCEEHYHVVLQEIEKKKRHGWLR